MVLRTRLFFDPSSLLHLFISLSKGSPIPARLALETAVFHGVRKMEKNWSTSSSGRMSSGSDTCSFFR